MVVDSFPQPLRRQRLWERLWRIVMMFDRVLCINHYLVRIDICVFYNMSYSVQLQSSDALDKFNSKFLSRSLIYPPIPNPKCHVVAAKTIAANRDNKP